jgi:Cu-Zn family superoxide dismutase
MPITEYALPGDAVYPEGVTLGPAGEYFVGSSSDGTLFRGRLTEQTAEVWLPAGTDDRTVALGLTVYDDSQLLVCGGGTGQLHTYDVRTRALVSRRAVDGFLNDVWVIGNDAFVTDSSRPVVWRFDLLATEAPPEPIKLPQAGYLNGITARDGVLLVADQGDEVLWRVDPDGSAEIIATGYAADGLLLLDDVLIGVCNRGETSQTAEYFLSALRLTPDGRAIPLGEHSDPRFVTPTTLALAADRLLVVNAQFAKRPHPTLPFTVVALPVPQFGDRLGYQTAR